MTPTCFICSNSTRRNNLHNVKANDIHALKIRHLQGSEGIVDKFLEAVGIRDTVPTCSKCWKYFSKIQKIQEQIEKLEKALKTIFQDVVTTWDDKGRDGDDGEVNNGNIEGTTKSTTGELDVVAVAMGGVADEGPTVTVTSVAPFEDELTKAVDIAISTIEVEVVAEDAGEVCQDNQVAVKSKPKRFKQKKSGMKTGSSLLCWRCGIVLSSTAYRRHEASTCPLLNPEEAKPLPPRFYCTVQNPRCRHKFASEEKLKKHLEEDHTEEKERDPMRRRVTCEICGTIVNKDHYKAHKRRMHGDTKYPCPLCDKKKNKIFKDEASLRQHINLFHEMSRNEKMDKYKGFAPFPCEICGKVSLGKHNYMTHKKTVHMNFTNMNCPHCGKGFYNKGNLERHIQTHRFPCSQCSSTFSSEVFYKRHMKKMHLSDKKPDQECSICHKVYFEKELRKHMQEFHGPPESCPKCGKTYKSRCTLRRHVLRAHGEKLKKERDQKCAICEKAFTTPNLLETHMAKMHKNKSLANTDENEITPEDLEETQDNNAEGEETQGQDIVTSSSADPNPSPTLKRRRTSPECRTPSPRRKSMRIKIQLLN